VPGLLQRHTTAQLGGVARPRRLPENRCHPARRSLNEASTISGKTHTARNRVFVGRSDKAERQLRGGVVERGGPDLIDDGHADAARCRPRCRYRYQPSRGSGFRLGGGEGGGRESGVHRQLDAVSYTSNPRTFFPSRRS